MIAKLMVIYPIYIVSAISPIHFVSNILFLKNTYKLLVNIMDQVID